jgi:hypothetical protein
MTAIEHATVGFVDRIVFFDQPRHTTLHIIIYPMFDWDVISGVLAKNSLSDHSNAAPLVAFLQ